MSVDIPSPSPYIHPSKIPLVEIKEPTISKIQVSEADLDKLQKILQSPKMCPMSKDMKQRKLIGICGCGGIPEYILTKYYDGVKLIEKYCAKCIEQEKQRGNFVFTGNQK